LRTISSAQRSPVRSRAWATGRQRELMDMSSNKTNETRTALVTGAFSGIGQATALRLAQAGWRVYAAGRHLERSAGLVAQAQSQALDVRPLLMDVTDEASIAAAMQQVERESGGLEVLVNNAGGAFRGAVTDAGQSKMR